MLKRPTPIVKEKNIKGIYPDTVRLETYQICIFCDHCKEEVEWDGHVLATNPPGYKHKCPKCLKTFTLKHQYPTVGYQPVKEKK